MQVPQGVDVVLGDITSEDDVMRALQGAELVFHIASYGGWGVHAFHTRLVCVCARACACACVRVGGRLWVHTTYTAVYML